MANKNNVFKDYDIIADWFDQNRSQELFEKAYLDKVITYLPVGATILDLGCGTGQPIAQYCIERGFAIVGIDGSVQLINRAQKYFPLQTWIVGDMRQIDLRQQFGAIIAWHSLFHLPVQDQRNMFAIFAKHVTSGGILLFTSGPQAGEVWSDNGGQMLYHASLSADEYKSLLAQYGFVLLSHTVEDPHCGGATVWMAQKN